MMEAEQCRMARAALEWSSKELATRAGVGINTVNRFERGQDSWISTAQKMQYAFEAAGIEFTFGEKPGVRMKRAGKYKEPKPALTDEHFKLMVERFRKNLPDAARQVGGDEPFYLDDNFALIRGTVVLGRLWFEAGQFSSKPTFDPSGPNGWPTEHDLFFWAVAAWEAYVRAK